MENTVINAQIFQGSKLLVEWSQPYDLNLRDLLKGISLTKEYLNNCLTDLSTKTKNLKNPNNFSLSEDIENDYEGPDDPLAEIFKKLTDEKKSSDPNAKNNAKRNKNSNIVVKKRKK